MWLELARKGSGHTPQALRKEQMLFKPKQLMPPPGSESGCFKNAQGTPLFMAQ